MRRLLGIRKPRIIGHIDDVSRRRLRGWAVDRAALTEPLWIDVLYRNRLVCSRLADLEREDLLRIGYPSAHGFEFSLDPALDAHDPALAIVARRAGHDVDLAASGNLVWPGGSTRDPRPRLRARGPVPAKDAIFIDVSDLISFLRVHNHLTGIQRVVAGLVDSVAAAGSEASDVHFTTTAEVDGLVEIVPTDGLVDLIRTAVAGGVAQSSLRRKIDAIEVQAQKFAPRAGDLYFIAGAYWIVAAFAQRINALKRAGVIVALYVYDLIPLTHGQYVSESTRRDVVERAIDFLSLADFCLSISEFVRNEVRALVSIELGRDMKVIATPLPYEIVRRQTNTEPGAILSKVGRDYVLCVGTLEGRKNHALLFDVWAALIRRHGAAQIPDLVLVGAWGWNIDAFRKRCDASRCLDGKIRIFNGLGDADLADLYANCRFTTFPSLVEGWGLPVGESLAAGKLCVASKASSVPEVGGEFCRYIDPQCFFDAYRAFEDLILDPTLVAAHEAEIAQNFVPRGWAEFGAGVIAALRQGRAAETPRGAVVPLLEPHRVNRFSRDFLYGDETVSWPTKQIKFMRIGAWGEIEDWGCWALAEKVALRFRATAPAGAMLPLLLELRLPPGLVGGTLRLTPALGPTNEAALSEAPRWLRVSAPVGADGIVEIVLDAPYAPAREPDRDLFFGLSRLVVLAPGESFEVMERVLVGV